MLKKLPTRIKKLIVNFFSFLFSYLDIDGLLDSIALPSKIFDLKNKLPKPKYDSFIESYVIENKNDKDKIIESFDIENKNEKIIESFEIENKNEKLSFGLLKNFGRENYLKLTEKSEKNKEKEKIKNIIQKHQFNNNSFNMFKKQKNSEIDNWLEKFEKKMVDFENIYKKNVPLKVSDFNSKKNVKKNFGNRSRCTKTVFDNENFFDDEIDLYKIHKIQIKSAIKFLKLK